MVLDTIQGMDLSPLAKHSPGLLGFDWTTYLRCSELRIVKTLEALGHGSTRPCRVLDYGSYFGNFSLALRIAGFEVDAVDAYDRYPVLRPCVELMKVNGINVSLIPPDVATYDAVLLMGVIEHIPGSPKDVLERAVCLLRPGGTLILDTPNLAYGPKRQLAAEGKPTLTPIQRQFYTAQPFEGHHREYTFDEVAWMVKAVGVDVTVITGFNYGGAAEEADVDRREIIFVVGRKS